MINKYRFLLILIFFSVANSYASNLSDFLKNTQQDLINNQHIFISQQQSKLFTQTTSNSVFQLAPPQINEMVCGGVINMKNPKINYDSLITLQFQGEYETWTPILNNYKKESYWKIISNPK